MTDEERAGVMEWLDQWASCNDGGTLTIRARQIKAILAQPRLPENPDRSFIRATFKDWPLVTEEIEKYHRALYAHLAKPKTKVVWDVRYEGEHLWSRYYTREEAVVNVERRLAEGKHHVEIREVEA